MLLKLIIFDVFLLKNFFFSGLGFDVMKFGMIHCKLANNSRKWDVIQFKEGRLRFIFMAIFRIFFTDFIV